MMLGVCMAGGAEVGPARGLEALFGRDQPRLARLLRWGDQLVAEADRFYAIDLKAATAAPVEVPGLEEVYDLADSGAGRLFAVGVKDGQRLLLTRAAAGGWVPQDLPAAARHGSTKVRLAASGPGLVLIADKQIFHHDGKAWRVVPAWTWPDDHPGRRGGPTHMLLHGGKLYFGFDRGEWGGGLICIDLATAAWTLVEDDSLPLQSLAVDRSGILWAAWGLAHLGGHQGTLRTFDGKAWKQVARCDNYEKDATQGWDLPCASFQAIAFDRQDAVHLLTGELGLLRRDGPDWVRLTPQWNQHQYTQSLAIVDDTAVIGTYDAGLILLRLPDGGIPRRVVFRAQ